MISYTDALKLITATVQPLPAVEMLLLDAHGLILAQEVKARWDLPLLDNSAMDGFAFAFAGQGAGAELPVAGLQRAGGAQVGAVPAGAGVRIMTGAPLPAGCDTVVPFEEVEELAGKIRLHAPASQGAHVRRRGEEFRQDELLLAAGCRLRAGEIGLLAAAGIERVQVHRQPVVALISTGDELVELGCQPLPGQIVNSNLYLLSARLHEEGVTVEALGVAGDCGASLEPLLRRGIQADLLLTTGGISAGDYDLVRKTLLGMDFKLGFWKVAIKPGKPVMFGTLHGTPVFGLPGNPAAAAATFQLFVRPALQRLAGQANPGPVLLKASLAAKVKGGGSRQTFLWGRLSRQGPDYVFAPSRVQGSGQNRSMAGIQALLPVAAESPDLLAGAEVEVMLIYLPDGGAPETPAAEG